VRPRSGERADAHAESLSAHELCDDGRPRPRPELLGEESRFCLTLRFLRGRVGVMTVACSGTASYDLGLLHRWLHGGHGLCTSSVTASPCRQLRRGQRRGVGSVLAMAWSAPVRRGADFGASSVVTAAAGLSASAVMAASVMAFAVMACAASRARSVSSSIGFNASLVVGPGEHKRQRRAWTPGREPARPWSERRCRRLASSAQPEGGGDCSSQRSAGNPWRKGHQPSQTRTT